MPLLADRVLESSITAGTGTLTLAGALTGYRTFNSAFSNGNVVYYTIDDGLGNWEVGYGTVGTGTLTRSTVLESSNANALVVFTSVSKRVFCTAPVPALLPDQTGNSTKILSTDGSNPSWIANTVGTVTSVGGTGTVNGITLTGTVTTSGDITLGGTLSGISLTTQVSGTLPVLNGGTGVTTSTGSGSVVLSASPTFTGTVNTANLAYTGTLTGGTGVINIGSGQLYKDASGNVGIGTSSPSSKLTVGANPPLSGAIAGVCALGGVSLALSDNANSSLYVKHVSAGVTTIGTDGGGQLSFSTNGFTERMRIDSSGNVGIGTSSPAQKLSVAGTIESTTGGVKFPDGTTQTTAATAGITTGKAIAMAMIFGF